jgi:hypothetical protein
MGQKGENNQKKSVKLVRQAGEAQAKRNVLYLRLMSPAALLEIEEKAQDVIDLEAVRRLVDQIYALDVSDWTDESLSLLESMIDKLVSLLSSVPNQQNRELIERLFTAREGVEQGMSPDPDKRPSLDEMRTFVSAHLA